MFSLEVVNRCPLLHPLERGGQLAMFLLFEKKGDKKGPT